MGTMLCGVQWSRYNYRTTHLTLKIWSETEGGLKIKGLMVLATQISVTDQI